MSLKIIFTWWNRQTFGTFLKTLFFGNMLVQMNMEINTIKVKKMNVGLFMQIYEATKITSDWYLWMHHTIDKIPDSKKINILAKKTFRKSNRYK